MSYFDLTRMSVGADFPEVRTFKKLPQSIQANIEESHRRGTGRPFTVEHITVNRDENYIEVLTVS